MEGLQKKLQGVKLDDLMDRYFMFYSLNIKKLASTFKHGNFQHSPLGNVMGMYIQLFPRQGSLKVYLFKIVTNGKRSGVDFVALMQPRGNL